MQANQLPAVAKTQLFQGQMVVNGNRIQVDFVAPMGATDAEKDAAFLAALAQKVSIDYIAIGESESSPADVAAEPFKPFEGTPYDQSDFDRNPVKYELFRTAIIAEEIPSSPELKVGQFVAISFWCVISNPARGNDHMPVYYVWTMDEDRDKEAPRTLFACALKGFCL